MLKTSNHSFLYEYGFAIISVAFSTALSFGISSHLAPINLVMIYLLGTLAVAARGHRGPAALSSALSVLAFDFFFVPPRFSFSVSDIEYIFTFVVMFIAAMIISHLTIRLRSEAEAARQGELRTTLMHEFSQNLIGAHGSQEVLRAAIPRLEKTLEGSVVAFIPREGGPLDAIGSLSPSITEKEHAVAHWAYENGKTAGLGEDSLPAESALYFPLKGSESTVGVLRIQPHSKQILTPQQRQLLNSFGHQIILALEVDRLEEKNKQTQLEIETERMRSSLLSSVSHDFRTPLTAIVGSASTLIENEEIRKGRKGFELLETIQSEAERLSRLVQNLLETTRLESGQVHLRKELYPFEEIIGSALERLAKPLQERKVTVQIPDDFPLVPLDGLLIEQVLINLLENVIRHTPLRSAIALSAKSEDNYAIVSVADEGSGIKEEDLERIFDKFYHDKSSPGAGLGLAICRAIIKAHGGKIWVENKTQKGAVFYFSLPLNNSHEQQ